MCLELTNGLVCVVLKLQYQASPLTGMTMTGYYIQFCITCTLALVALNIWSLIYVASGKNSPDNQSASLCKIRFVRIFLSGTILDNVFYKLFTYSIYCNKTQPHKPFCFSYPRTLPESTTTNTADDLLPIPIHHISCRFARYTNTHTHNQTWNFSGTWPKYVAWNNWDLFITLV